LIIFKDIVSGLSKMHSLGIAHRDIKVENILKDGNKFKLCDFGSASKQVLSPKLATKAEVIESYEMYEKYTTLIYRPPEMTDQYLGYTVDLQADMWMLGCVLYALCFGKHPFTDAQKLAIINA